jgi:hypothetical protein
MLDSSIGIQKHLMGIEIPGFDLANWFSGLTTSLFYMDGIHKVISLFLNILDLGIVALPRVESRPVTYQISYPCSMNITCEAHIKGTGT